MHQSWFHLENIKDLPDEAYWHALKATEHQRSQRLKASKGFQTTLRRLRERYPDELHALIGEENLEKYRKLHERRVKRTRSLRKKTPKTAGGLHKLQEQRRADVEQSRKLIVRSGVDVAKIKALQDRYREKVEALCLDTVGKGETIPGKPLRLKTGEQLVELTPPYIWAQYDADADSTNVEPTYHVYCHQFTGGMEHESVVEIIDAGDSEYAYVRTLTEVCKICTVPAESHIVVAVAADFETGPSEHSGYADDECWLGHYSVLEDIRAVLRIKPLWPTGGIETRTARLGGFEQPFNINGSPFIGDVRWHFNIWEEGDKISAGAVFGTEYTPGQYLAVWAGLETENVVWANDYRIRSSMSHDHTLNRIALVFH